MFEMNLKAPRVSSSEDDVLKEDLEKETEIILPHINRGLRRKYFIPKENKFSNRVKSLISQ